MTIGVGDRLLHYRLVEKIGEGGMGVVFRAEDTRLGRQVALKILPDAMAADRDRLARFEREARAVARLNHPNIVTLYAVEEADTPSGRVHFTTMELVQGQTLTTQLSGEGMPLDRLLDVAVPLAEAVSAAHRAGITHRDLKPDNIMIGADGRLRVLDFGLAKHAPGTGGDDTATRAGLILGTVHYMSPEQAEGGAVDARSDIFSLGTILYEMASGRRPFQGKTTLAILGAILRDDPVPVAKLRPSLPEGFVHVIARCLRKRPDDRYATAGELAEDLRTLASGTGGPLAHAPPARSRPRSRLLVGLTAVVAALLLLYFQPWGPPAETAGGPTDGASAGSVRLATGGRPSLAVLTFVNADGDPAQTYLGEGLTDEITMELSRYPELFVVSRSSTLAAEAGASDLRQVAEALGVRYVLEGSVRRLGDRFRVAAQLTDTRDGKLVWGETYEPRLTAGDFFDAQDDLTLQVVTSVAGTGGALSRSGLAEARRKAPPSLDSYDCVLFTYEYFHAHTPENHRRARDCLEAALTQEPDYAEGWAWLSYLYVEEYHHRFNERTEAPTSLVRAADAAKRALDLDRGSQAAHAAHALTCILTGDVDLGVTAAERAIELNPNNAFWLSGLGVWLCCAGEFERGIPFVERAEALNPRPPPWLPMGAFLDRYDAGDYEAALAEALAVDTQDYRTPLFRAATYAQLGRMDEAQRNVVEWRRAFPYPVEELRGDLLDRNGFAPALVEHLLEGLREAGVDVPASAGRGDS